MVQLNFCREILQAHQLADEGKGGEEDEKVSMKWQAHTVRLIDDASQELTVRQDTRT